MTKNPKPLSLAEDDTTFDEGGYGETPDQFTPTADDFQEEQS